MAITQNTFTGNGSNLGPFSFTFKWLEPTDIKVTVGGVLKTAGTHYNLQSLNYTTKDGGQVLFTAGNAPADNATIRVYRDTNDSALSATFFSGSAIRAQDLNDNFTQNLYVTQEVNNNAVDISGLNPMAGNLDLNSFKAINSATPTSGSDLANKTYVDDKVSASAVAGSPYFLQDGPGAVNRSWDSKLKDVVSVKDFGAVGDGSTDDTVALQAALAASKHVIIPSNTTIKITSGIVLANGTTIEGADRVTSVILVDGDHNGIDLRRYSTLCNLRVRGRNTMTSTRYLVGLAASGGDSARSNITNCIIGGRNTEIPGDTANERCNGTAIKGSVSFLNNISNCYVFNSKVGLAIDGSVTNAITVTGTEFHKCGVGGTITAPQGVVLTQCTFENSDEQGLIIQSSRSCVLTGCYFEKNNTAATATIKADLLIDDPDPGAAIKLDNLFFFRGGTNTDYGLYIDRQKGVSLDGAYFNSYQNAINYLYAGNTNSFGYGVLKNVFATDNGASRSILGTRWQLYGFQHVGLDESSLSTFGQVKASSLRFSSSAQILDITTGGRSYGSNGVVQGTVTPPSGANRAEIVVTGADYATYGNLVHTGLNVSHWSSVTNLIYTAVNTNHSAGSNQGFNVTWTGTAIQIANKTGMTSNQSGNFRVVFYS